MGCKFEFERPRTSTVRRPAREDEINYFTQMLPARSGARCSNTNSFVEERARATRCERLNGLFIGYGRARIRAKKQLVPLSCLIEPTPEPKRARDSESTRGNLSFVRSSVRRAIDCRRKASAGTPRVDKQPVDLRLSPRATWAPITRSFTETR